MSEVFDFNGVDEFYRRGVQYPNPKESDLFLSLGSPGDVYFPLRKRSRISAPFIFSEEPKKQPSIDVLPEECLFEVLRRLGGQERSVSACVSKRWLMLLSSMRVDEICTAKPTQVSAPESNSQKENDEGEDGECQENGTCGYLSRCLEGKKVSDVRLAAIVIGTASRGGLGKLTIRGSAATRGLTNSGLKAVSHGCPSLKVLSLCNLSSVSDEGMYEIASGIHSLEKLNLYQCPAITDKGLITIAMNSPNLKSVTVESCLSIGNDSLQALGRYCPNLTCVTVKNCPLVGDQGVANLLSSAGHILTKANFQALNISDMALAVIGHYGKAMTHLSLVGLQNVNERGFWVMGKGMGLKKLKSLSIMACGGVTDLGLEALGNGCPDMKLFGLKKCPFVSDNGLVSFVKASKSLESLQLEECHRITQCGMFGVLANCGEKLKAFALTNCLGMRDLAVEFPLKALCHSLRSVTIRNCPGFGDAGLGILMKLCPKLTHLDLTGLQGITDAGLLPLVRRSEDGLEKVNLTGCVNLTDNVVNAIAKLHGETLELLNLDGCRCITDASLMSIARNCSVVLSELDVSNSGVTDSGVAVLAGAVQLSLQIISFAGCTSVSDKSFPFIKRLGRTLVGLNIQHCPKISSGTVGQLTEQLWRCDILS